MSGRTIEFSKEIRGVEVWITAEDFSGDESVGIGIGPDCVTAKRLDNAEDFELTDDEVEAIGIEATESYLADDYP
jgi:hypothetical protein